MFMPRLRWNYTTGRWDRVPMDRLDKACLVIWGCSALYLLSTVFWHG